MKRLASALSVTALAITLTGCSNGGDTPATSTTPATNTVTSTATSSSSSSTTVTPSATEETTTPSLTTTATAALAPAPAVSPTFVECWENDAAMMSDGSIIYDPVNCHLASDEEIRQRAEAYFSTAPTYSEPVRADGCVGPAAVCGYYDESGNPIWFDKTTGETSPRFYDQFGNPTMSP
ncbi:hypothetical protein [Corynebacterium pacaense]|uniref:hypothetical protein n=1 Tax=Corynebacterium pacaense TaxID=1816684 RepID=UPI00117809B9|nr:hypothetical protein [Corynebacterium pacaense]